ncbi:MAG: DUF1501 domain-containing protein [Parvularculaceae bacterium]|nr:DUF1501 domain-containing protein [Parvularculaceae bacterium]
MLLSRRRFLQTSALGLGATGLAPLAARAADQSGYKALVFIFLNGGADAHDMLIGYDQPSYDNWASARSSIIAQIDEFGERGSRSRDNLLKLNPSNSGDFGGREFAMPPEMAGMHNLFETGRLAIVPNVGPLLEPTSRSMIDAETALLPDRLFSHNDQASTWTAFSGEGASNGWGGAMLDAFTQSSPYTAVSLRGENVFLQGRQTRQVALKPDGDIKRAFGTEDELWGSAELSSMLTDYLSNPSNNTSNVLMRDVINAQGRAIADTERFSTVLSGQTLGDSVVVPRNYLSEQLAMIANVIASRSQLGVSRQIFFARLDGFDTHKNHVSAMPELLRTLSEAVTSFQTALENAGLADLVTTFTGSDFGRSLVSNATGTDHGWGGHHFVIGNQVAGGRIAGSVPSFELGNDQHWKRGTMIPQIAVEQYGAEMGSWFGLSNSELNEVFTNRDRFDTTPLGLFT